ncbi:hypothetical protein [Pontibacter pamirensis]|uniref:hypothetical protein n=1 Tax=Pontibacter pamirensis TaxID=2562824 RepID=UPI00138A58E2|nr:hypothetical protein [Pontibacter pamirensis]
MNYIAIILSIIALIGAGFAILRASSSHRILMKRIETLKERNNAQEARLRKLEGNSGRGNKPAREPNEPDQRNQPRQKQPRHEQEQQKKQRQNDQLQQVSQASQQTQEIPQQTQPRKKKENRRRNEPTDRTNFQEQGEERPIVAAKNIRLEIAEGDFLDNLERSSENNPTATVAESGIKYAVIPEDGLIRMHQLQQQPDSDSYLEVDVPADGSNITNYRFNLAGNHAFVIAQGIDRLENAFSFEKPSNRMVSTVVQQQDGVLTRVNNGWKIQEKARIDFR